MPQQEQDELFDFYSSYGMLDKDGSHIGLFKRARPVGDDSQFDIKWADFVAGNLSPTVAAREQAREARAIQTAPEASDDRAMLSPMDAILLSSDRHREVSKQG